MLADDHPLRRLAEQYPACFNLVGHERQPIKIGIGDELAALDTGLTPLQLGRALATYVRHSGYQCKYPGRCESHRSGRYARGCCHHRRGGGPRQEDACQAGC